MKILSARQIRDADEYTIENEPISSIDLMERASMAFIEAFITYYSKDLPVSVFCGLGNNGGDGLAISRLLLDKGFDVTSYVVGDPGRGSSDFLVNYERLQTATILLDASSQKPLVAPNAIVIDALFGSGLNRSLDGFNAEIVNYLNGIPNVIVSVDIASGLYSERPLESDTIIKPVRTISFQSPKLSFFQPDLATYVGKWECLDIGLSTSFINEVESHYFYTQEDQMKAIYRPRSKYDHKGSAGKVQLWAGRKGSMGAAQLAAKACLRAGVGLLYIKTPQCGEEILQVSVPEAMVEVDTGDHEIQTADFNPRVDVIGIGPGLGTSKLTGQALSDFLSKYDGRPLVIDADGINLLAMDKTLLERLPEDSILTPHPGEFQRLVGSWDDDYQKLALLRKFCRKHRLNLVLKGAHSAVCDSLGDVHFNSTGNPGMATAGSGDVLFGIICALLARGMRPFDALRFGVFLHGRAGDLAKVELGEESLIASDLISYLSKSFLSVTG